MATSHHHHCCGEPRVMRKRKYSHTALVWAFFLATTLAATGRAPSGFGVGASAAPGSEDTAGAGTLMQPTIDESDVGPASGSLSPQASSLESFNDVAETSSSAPEALQTLIYSPDLGDAVKNMVQGHRKHGVDYGEGDYAGGAHGYEASFSNGMGNEDRKLEEDLVDCELRKRRLEARGLDSTDLVGTRLLCSGGGSGGGTVPTPSPATATCVTVTDSYWCSSYSSSCGKGCTEYRCSKCTCIAGYYTSLGYGRSAYSCTACPSGTYASSAGATFCYSCIQGQYAAATSSTACSNCPCGQFNWGYGQSSCMECPVGYYCAAGSVTYVGFACATGKISAAGSCSCSSCPIGKFQSSSTACTDCPCGQLNPSTSVSSCIACPAGHYCGAGASAPLPATQASTLLLHRAPVRVVQLESTRVRPLLAPTALVAISILVREFRAALLARRVSCAQQGCRLPLTAAQAATLLLHRARVRIVQL